ncbi:MAG: 30S ribosomal protein S8e [Candidatus Heimdallarchaeota archaeon]|nr:30S ribosomal protein S8e [Candidatus Heimdallarchaeota archaeon]
MVTFQGKSGRIISGGKLKSSSQKRKRQLGRPAAETQIADERKRFVRTQGGNYKIRLFRTKTVSVMNPSTGKAIQAEITDVDTNPASRAFSRRRVITKGAILVTSVGKARVTNKPGKEGFVNAVLISE